MAMASAGTRSLPLFDKYGGMSALRAVIMDFYDRALDSDVVGPFFENVDMARLIDHQTKFMAMLLGGPVGFSEDRLQRAHAHLKVEHAHFDEIVALISQTLGDAGFSEDDRQTVLRAVEARRPRIVT